MLTTSARDGLSGDITMIWLLWVWNQLEKPDAVVDVGLRWTHGELELLVIQNIMRLMLVGDSDDVGDTLDRLED